MPYKDKAVGLQKARERGKAWRANNRQKILEKQRQWRARHPQKRSEYYAKYRVKQLQSQKRRITEQPEKRRDQIRRHYLKKRDYYIRKYRERRAKLVGSVVNPKSIELFIAGVRSKSVVVCYYCNHSTPGKSAHIDHIVPLSRGGPHSVENLCASCPKCNWSKNDTMIKDWFRLGQQILSL